MSTVSLASATVVIVDSNLSDYDELLSASESSGLNVHFLSSGRDALQFARRWQAALWLVNTSLADMSGFDVAQRLRRIEPASRIFIVGDDYQVDDELQTLTLGLSKYVCKPLEPSWILPLRRRSAMAEVVRTLPFPTLPMTATLADPSATQTLQGEPAEDEVVSILPFLARTQPRPAA